METKMKPCKFQFDDGPIWDGFAHGSTWNGFDNVAVTKETLEKIIVWSESNGCDADDIDGFRSIDPMEGGLISLGWGYATQIVPNVDAVSDEDIKTAVAIDDLDQACRHLQDIADIRDGGVAGQCFSDIDFDWQTADRAEREQKVRDWLNTERMG